jgi:hypothetical protein
MLKRRYLSEALYPMQSPVVRRPRSRPAKQPAKYSVAVPDRCATPPVTLTLFDLTAPALSSRKQSPGTLACR